ncbi:alpha/beta hydrolase [Pigmentiphaga sp.]|jgi:Esterase/lipase|uniref:alpha/beta hydrolase n=1 Tax=Pigmentiphaga sp. TaxID=1977564 RepID=UPI0025E4C5DF|nr:alpha/beta hydrolase [Pigmentiphaga sp.]MBX6318402.1 alpha/beta hydrolase [Pigmentiphaga sp.]
MTAMYNGMPREELDVAYDNCAAVLNSAVLMAEFNERSAKLRAAYPQYLDLRYGPASRNRIDYFPAARPGPLMVFIHGGYWQSGSKDSFSFLAAGPLAHGLHVAVVGYTLAPEQSLGGIVGEIRSAIGWLTRHASQWGTDPDRLIVCGWSAGAHLAAMVLDEPGVSAGLAISGIYDLEPIRLSHLNERLCLCPPDVQRLSPLHRPLSRRELILAYGAAELPEFQRQAETFAAARAGLPGELLRVADRNHFTILNDLASPDGILVQRACKLAGL